MQPSAPDIVEAVRHHQAGRLEDAAVLYDQILRADPAHSDALHLSGVIQLQRGRHAEAVQRIQQAVALQPNSAVFHNNLGSAHLELGETTEAVKCFEQACQLDQGYGDAWYNLGNALRSQGRLDEAVAAYQQALKLDPQSLGTLTNLGATLQTKNDFAGAIHCYETALRHDPQHVDAWHNLGLCYDVQCQLDRAEKCFRKALSYRQDFAEAYNSLATTLRLQGRMDEARECFERVIAINPQHRLAPSNWLMSLDYLPDASPQMICAQRCRWGNAVAAQIPAETIHTNIADPDRRLKIGYLSPDFREHAVASFFEPILSKHGNAVTAVCYADVAVPDAVTERLKSQADIWREIFGRTDDEVARMILDDRIDILVDLAGHTARNRLTVFARKPAPVQVTYLGDAATTGLATMDYRLTDNWADPWFGDEQSRETLLRLPGGFLCFQPPSYAPEVGPLPAEQNGYVTFGSFNSLAKVNAEVIRLWAALLDLVPQSRLLLKAGALRDAAVRDRLQEMFAERGLSSARVELIGQVQDFAEHLDLYNQIDIGLDTFPYAGTTTTCEALWMGVPVVSLSGKTHVSRVGVSLLSQLGLNDLATDAEEDYLQIAGQLANDLPRLAQLRSGLRTAMAGSSLCDAAGFTQRLKTVYRTIWQQWCDVQNR